MARNRMPTATKVLEGTLPEESLKHEPQPRTDEVFAPEWLDPLALEEWNRLAPELIRLGLLTNADIMTFAAYCEAVADFQKATEAITFGGITMPASSKHSNADVKNPANQVKREAAQAIKQFSSLFGLSPADRARIPAQDTMAQEINDILNG